YALGRAVETSHDSVGAETVGGYVGGKAGIDAKLGITPTLTADLTASTDFAQVEADQQVINLTRFPFFFPEKREFFLESSGLLDLGTPERVQLFYSRRIGLDTSGAPVPIIAGGRVYGRLGPWKIGVLDAHTGGGD
ncbi:MAG: hydrolase, partial [Gemmatimonadetes bacterium]